QMAAPAQDDRASLTGTWNGLYFYPGESRPTSFVATLHDAASHFTGTISETEEMVTGGMTLHANVQGRRTERTVHFTKTYDGTGGWHHSVAYDGTVNAEATEIEGRWHVGGVSGTFLMIRGGAAEEAELREAEERVKVPEEVT